MTALQSAHHSTLDAIVAPPVRNRAFLRLLVVGAASVTALYVALASGNGAAAPAAGVPYAGQLVEVGLPLLRLLSWLLGVTVFGAIMLLVLIPLGPHDHVRLEALKFAAALSAVWAVVVLLELVVATASLTGTPLDRISWATVSEAAGLIQVKLLAAQAVLIGLAVIAARVEAAAARPLAWVSLAVVFLALLPPIASGHAIGSERSPLVIGLLVIHVAAASAWVGGLSAVVWSVRRGMDVLAVTVHRFSAVALVSAAAITGTGVVDALLRLEPTVDGILRNPYGQIVVAKLVGTGLLSAIGLVHRLRTLPAISAGKSVAFIRFAVVEMVIMGAVFGLATALAQTPS